MVEPETTASFGYWVRRQRLALDLTQADLARKVGCATVTITKIERDERRPSRQIAELLADSLAVPAADRARFIAVALGEKTVDSIPLADRPLTASAESRLSNLPVPLTPFVGRRQELEQLTENLNHPTCRLLTLAGPGGTGKTRLGIRLGELAREQVDQYPDGVYFVALDGLDNPMLVVPAVAEALRFTFYTQTEQTEQLLRYLAGKRLLLILDNAEGRLDRTLVERILTSAPQVKLIVTSREALRVPHEWFFPLAGMRLPEPSDGDKDSWQAADAVQLFAGNALRARPDFDLVREQVHVTRICQLVDGAPLAIELAAAWLRILPCAQIAEEVERGLDLLATTLHGVPERHRSMSVVLEQTWRQLTGEEQRVFRRLSVFSGKFHPKAAQVVAEASFQTLATLVERSMVHLTGDGYYRMHLLLQRLGAEKLANDAAELTDVQARHAGYYMRFLGTRSKVIAGPQSAEILAEVQAEYDNVRSAWRHAVAHHDWTALTEAFPCLFRVLWVQGRYSEGEGLLSFTLEPAGQAEPTEDEWSLWIMVALRRAQLASAMGAYSEALAQLESTHSHLERWGTPTLRALYHLVTGIVIDQAGKPDRGIEHMRLSYDAYSDLRDDWGIAECAMRLGYAIFNWGGDLVTGQALLDEALRLYRKLGDPSDIADALDHVGLIRYMAGQLDESEQYYTDGLALAQRIGHRLVIARAIGGLGLVAWGRDQWEPAIQFFQQRLKLTQDIGHDNQALASLNFLCGIYADAGRFADAVALIDKHPDMWRTAWTAQAQIGAGHYVEAMSYLPQETVSYLQIESPYNLARYLIAWAMLLLSDRELVIVAWPDGTHVPLDAETRSTQVVRLLAMIRSDRRCDPSTLNQARRLLARAIGETGIHADVDSVHIRPASSIDEIARELLNIRLAEGQ